MNQETNFLARVIERKRARLCADGSLPLEAVRARALEVRRGSQPHAFRRALERCGGPGVIAEIKRASPSKGIIKENFEPTALARAYTRGGAAALSVLTEESYFRGSLDDLRAVRDASQLPILRKDFIIDEWQIYETAAAGADALLLIVAALNDGELSRFRRITEEELGMDALVEVHTSEEMRRAGSCGARLLGVNNRNLRTFEVSLSVSIDLASGAFPATTVLISESGLRSAEDIQKLHALGYRGFLIGEALMRADRPTDFLRSLIRQTSLNERALVKVCGITNLKDARICVDAGADLLGFNFYSHSPRCIAPLEARRIIEQLPSEVLSVGVFVDEESPEKVTAIADSAGVAVIQLHGEETPQYCRALKGNVIKALRVAPGFIPDHVSAYETEAILLDAFSSKARGGTGERCDWLIAKQVQQYVSRLFLAGGLTPENVAEAIAVVQPYAVDVCSSVESTPGRKDERRVQSFITNAKRSKSAAVSE